MPARVAVILLAAGGSTRLGSPKQLLVYEGKSLLRRAAESALTWGRKPAVVVLGAGSERLRQEVEGLEVVVVENPAWEQGMGGSVRRGMAAVDAGEQEAAGGGGLDGVLLTLCDQPLVGAEALGRIGAAFDAGGRAEDAIVAAAYLKTVGVPVLFGTAYFEALRTLPEDAGAKGLLRRHAGKVIAVPMPEGAVDVDTREQYERLKAGRTKEDAATGPVARQPEG